MQVLNTIVFESCCTCQEGYRKISTTLHLATYGNPSLDAADVATPQNAMQKEDIRGREGSSTAHKRAFLHQGFGTITEQLLDVIGINRNNQKILINMFQHSLWNVQWVKGK